MTTTLRLQKYMAECGVASRRGSEEFIAEGRVHVNGKVVTKPGTKIDPERDEVTVNRKPIKRLLKGVVLLNKPKGVISTLSDPENRRTIAEYLGKRYRGYFPVGRLDWESSGLIILTNDGEMADRLMHPRYSVPRTYRVRVEGRVSQAVVRKLTGGFMLDDGPIKAISVSFVSDDHKSTTLEVTVKEGRNRLVRRMMDAVGHPVIKLKRISHGPFKLNTLPAGRVRPLTESEYKIARRKVFGSKRDRTVSSEVKKKTKQKRSKR